MNNKKKRLLSEEVTRRMMKLAKIDKYADSFLNESMDMDMEDEQELDEMEKVDHSHPDHKMKNAPKGKKHSMKEQFDEEEPMDDMGDDMPPMNDEPMDDMDMGDDMGDMGSNTERLVQAIADAIQAETGISIDVNSELGGDVPMDEPMDDMPMDDEPMDDMGGDDMPPMDDEPMDEEPPMEEAGMRLKGATKEVPMQEKDKMYEQEVFDTMAKNIAEKLKRSLMKAKASKKKK